MNLAIQILRLMVWSFKLPHSSLGDSDATGFSANNLLAFKMGLCGCNSKETCDFFRNELITSDVQSCS